MNARLSPEHELDRLLINCLEGMLEQLRAGTLNPEVKRRFTTGVLATVFLAQEDQKLLRHLFIGWWIEQLISR